MTRCSCGVAPRDKPGTPSIVTMGRPIEEHIQPKYVIDKLFQLENIF